MTTPAASEPPERAPADRSAIAAENVRQLRLGTGANCSSVGSVVDTLFATAAVGAALFAGIVAALRSEPIRVTRPRRDDEAGPSPADEASPAHEPGESP